MGKNIKSQKIQLYYSAATLTKATWQNFLQI